MATKALNSGEFLILFRSYSPAEGNTAAIVSYAPDCTRSELMVLQTQLTRDNFSSSQRTLLMKFELLPEE